MASPNRHLDLEYPPLSTSRATPMNDHENRDETSPMQPQPQPLPLQIMRFPATSSSHPRNDSADASSPGSDSSLEQPEIGTLSDHEPDPPRRGDPEWVARPRNPFIIFRCEYSQRNSRGDGKRIRRAPGAPIEPSLSKRAAEAWHELPAEEKERFKKLADLEREEHTRLHPLYRFRPAKRKSKKQAERSAASSHPSSAHASTTSFHHPYARSSAQSRHYPAADASSESLVPSPNASLVYLRRGSLQDTSSYGYPLVSPPTSGPPTTIGPAKANRRRSCSQPLPPPRHLAQNPSLALNPLPNSTRLDLQRSRSDNASFSSTTSLGSQQSSQGVGVLSPTGSEIYETLHEPFSQRSRSPTPGTRSPLHKGPDSANTSYIHPIVVSTASSLENWDGGQNFQPNPASSHSSGCHIMMPPGNHDGQSPASSSPWMNLANLSLSTPSAMTPMHEYINPMATLATAEGAYYIVEGTPSTPMQYVSSSNQPSSFHQHIVEPAFNSVDSQISIMPTVRAPHSVFSHPQEAHEMDLSAMALSYPEPIPQYQMLSSASVYQGGPQTPSASIDHFAPIPIRVISLTEGPQNTDIDLDPTPAHHMHMIGQTTENAGLEAVDELLFEDFDCMFQPGM